VGGGLFVCVCVYLCLCLCELVLVDMPWPALKPVDLAAGAPPGVPSFPPPPPALPAVNCLQLQDQSRRDDLWGWLYCLVELLEGAGFSWKHRGTRRSNTTL
jgi:hypothetical protein